MRLIPWVLIAMLSLVLVAPADAQSDSTETTLYFHVFDTFNKFPINTQPMDVDFFEVGGTNFPTWRAQGWDFNTIYGYSTAGPVEYDFIENGRPRFHPERGIAQDVQLDPGVQPVVYFYMDIKDVIANDAGPMLLPYYTVDITVRTGDDPGDTEKLDDGDLLMEGSMTAHLWSGHTAEGADEALAGQSGPQDIPVLVPDAAGIIEWRIPMETETNTLPKDDAFNVRIDWYQDPQGAMGQDEFATGWMRLAADSDHLPRMELAVLNPVYVEYIHPQVAAGTLLIHTGVNSPWGTYDVNVADMSLQITGPDGSVVKEHLGAQHDGDATKLERFVSQGTHVHDQHDKAAEITYMWKFRDDDAKNGQYDIELTVPNLRGNAEATSSAKFVVEEKRAFGEDDTGRVVEPTDDDASGKDSPGPGLLVPLALLGIALRRWRA